jgi:hypothetical protein
MRLFVGKHAFGNAIVQDGFLAKPLRIKSGRLGARPNGLKTYQSFDESSASPPVSVGSEERAYTVSGEIGRGIAAAFLYLGTLSLRDLA